MLGSTLLSIGYSVSSLGFSVGAPCCRGVVAVSDSDGLVAHVSIELRAPVRHPWRERAGENVVGETCPAALGGLTDAAEVAVRHGAVVEHRKRRVELAVAH